MQLIRRALHTYKLLSLTIVAIIIGLALDLASYDRASHWLLGLVAGFAAILLIWDMLQTLRSGKYGIDLLAATAIITSIILGQYWAAIVIVLMLTGGEGLEAYAEHRAHRELEALVKHAPQTATVLRKGKTTSVKASEVQIGDKIIIKAGELVPADAVIIEGGATFDESSLTGESLPQPKAIGDSLLSGSINLDGPVTAKATASANDSQYQQIIRLVKNASVEHAPFVRLADRYSIPFTLLAFGIASGAWYISGEAIRFLEVLVVATPCPLILAAPIAMMSGMSRASRYGIIIKTGSSLERLADTQTMVFDKTGTLTEGKPQVDDVQAAKGFTAEQVLSLAASLEQSSNHVVAQAIIREATAQKLKIQKVKHAKERPGLGLEARLKNQVILVGTARLLEVQGVKLPSSVTNKQSGSRVYVAVGQTLAGYISLGDQLRPQTAATIDALSALKVKETVMVTGDNQASANLIAKQLGLTQVHANALPSQKLQIIEKLTRRPVTFVGDGINDAPALTAANTGVALGARGSAAASESADVVILVDDISRVAAAIQISKRTFTIAQQSIFIGIGLSLILMGVYATGKFSVLSGAIIQELIDVVVIANALRAQFIKPLELE